MTPKALLFSRYRAFRDNTRLELAPLTVIIGKNGGGKSVITRLPLLIASGLSSEADAPLDLMAGGISHASRYEDLIFQRSAQPFSIGAEISDRNRVLTFSSKLRHVVERHALAIEAFELHENGERVVSLNVSDPEDIGQPYPQFQVMSGISADIKSSSVEFIGLFPLSVTADQAVSERLQEARHLFEKAFRHPSYLGPFRSQEGVLPRIPRQGVRSLGTRGEHALDLLSDDAFLGSSDLISAVETWFEQGMDGSRVLLQGAADVTRMLVHDPQRNVDIDLAETGAGFAQVFPIVVQSFARRLGRLTCPLILVEQPELHLHPAAHGAVADLMANTIATCGDKVRYICETHSEQLIARLRRRIAEGVIAPDAVTIISVGHQSASDAEIEPLRTICLDQSGTPNAWPAGVFSEAFDDLVLMQEASKKRNADSMEPQR